MTFSINPIRKLAMVISFSSYIPLFSSINRFIVAISMLNTGITTLPSQIDTDLFIGSDPGQKYFWHE